MQAKRKRAPGGGRKPSGPFIKNTAQLTIRMPADIRKQLELSAARRRNGEGWKLTQEMLHRLQRSFDKERDEQRDPANRALGYLLSHVIRFVAAITDGGQWRSDPFAFRTVKLAFGFVLDALEPEGEMRAPRNKSQPVLGDTYIRGTHFQLPGNTPEDLAESVRDVILFELARESNEPEAPDKTFSQQTELAMQQAARALIPAKKGERR